VEREKGQQVRDLDAPHHGVTVVVAEDVLGGPLRGLREALHRRQLDRLVLRDVPGRPVADDHLQRRGDAPGGHRDAQRRALVAAAPPAEHRPRVHAREQESAHDVGGEVHVDVLAPEHRVVEQGLPGVDVGSPAVDQREARRVIHPPVDRDHEERPRHAGDRDGDAGQEVEPWRDPVPAIRINPEKDGFHEEGEPFEREAQAEDIPEVLHPYWPQQA
jgi:hypothetical protein